MAEVSKDKGEDSDGRPNLVLLFPEENGEGKVYRITPDDSPCSIGRSVKCKLRFPESSLSRVQCEVRFVDGAWVIVDGDGEKPSKNGTWIFAEQEVPLADGSLIKAGSCLFRISFASPKVDERE